MCKKYLAKASILLGCLIVLVSAALLIIFAVNGYAPDYATGNYTGLYYTLQIVGGVVVAVAGWMANTYLSDLNTV